ncbi:esterase-like activity of phytase family protein [Salipiger mangrovisoli]|uniref:Esterase-like activity of phytase family protein n=1 Tax=Salipiger mangrovisoli TaxID=2865933 RepID=A0ABR9X1U2_9RHOB|nr:esterase-like activity of phytase family protein [Salipiger mangrovisoli]MBE9637540.1 esterase-like activity of phytase family protein [Salipiger mangrovisoli]
MRIRRRSAVIVAGLACLLAVSACAGSPEATASARYIGTYTWSDSHDRFGGFSGLEVSDDGLQFTAISDRGSIVMGHFTRAATSGRITGLAASPVEKLLDETGTRIHPDIDDAEGLAIGADGRLYVSFEGPPRIHASERYDLPATVLPRGSFYPQLQNNSGMEALAIDDRGRLLTLPERSGQITRPFPVWRLENGTWSHVFDLPRRGGYLAVGADIGPDGRFYLLEREFTGYAFRSRVRRFDIAGDVPRNEATLLESTPFEHDNLEGLAVWSPEPGRIRLTMISDDNFKFFQKTQLVEYELPESLDPRALSQ